MVKHDDHAMTWYDQGDSYSPWYDHGMAAIFFQSGMFEVNLNAALDFINETVSCICQKELGPSYR